MPSLSVCKPIFYGSRRIFPFLGFAITNIIKLFNKSKFKGWLFRGISGEFSYLCLTERYCYGSALRLCFRDCQPNVPYMGVRRQLWRVFSNRFFPRMGFRASVGGRAVEMPLYERAVFGEYSDYPFPAGHGYRHREILDGDALCL